jgi:preprotein translocase subunit SecG
MNNNTIIIFIIIFMIIILPVMGVAIDKENHEKENKDKSIIFIFHVKNNIFTLVSSEIIIGKNPSHYGEYDDFFIKEIGKDNEVLKKIGISDPTLFRIADVDPMNPDEPKYVTRDDVNFTIILPYSDDIETITIEDKEGNIVLSTNLDESKKIFFLNNFEQELYKEKSDLGLLNILFIVIIVFLFLGIGIYYLNKKAHKKNKKLKKKLRKK